MPHPTATTDPPPPAQSSNLARIGIVALIIGGALFWWLIGKAIPGSPLQGLAALVAVAIGMLPPVSASLRRWGNRVKEPTPHRAIWVALIISILSALLLYFAARLQQRDFNLILHDEYSYRLQTVMLSTGRLWLPAHLLPDFFDAFQLIIRPVYASAYFPGTALLAAPLDLMGLPYWMMPLAISGLTVGLLYLNLTLLIDGVVGALAAVMLMSTNLFRMLSIMLLSQTPTLALCLTATAAAMLWRRSNRSVWLVLSGIAIGWAGITRPVDACCFLPPLAFLIFAPTAPLPRARRAVLAILGVLPFIIFQLIFNLGVTGSLLKTPYALYAHADNPGLTLGFPGFDPTKRPASDLPQKQIIYETVVAPLVENHRLDRVVPIWINQRLPQLFGFATPHPLLLWFIPAGVFFSLRARHWVLVAPLPFFIAAYVLYPFYLPHYALVMCASLIAIILAAWRALSLGSGAMKSSSPAVALGIIALCVTSWPGIDFSVSDQMMDAPLLRDVDAQLDGLPDDRALVFFRFSPDRDMNVEPVYNFQSASPDDARIIRAHDRGAQNIQLIDYYRNRHPDRAVYLYDESTGRLSPVPR